ncbi:calcium-activated chloride channel-domain-containing protein [Chiua virens]|nr:calcium-activated chloride channel-domain-containing protein [Chiua virens]
MPPYVDVVVVFRAASKGAPLSKEQTRKNAAKTERQYTRLMETLTRANLKAVGRRGENQDQLLILVTCPPTLLLQLVHRERYSDFLCGLPMTGLPSAEADLDSAPLSSADRVRLVHAYITSTPHGGGLGIIPGCEEWDLVQSVMALHNHEFNDQWIRLWTRHRIASMELEKIRDQFGDSVALYFFFLTAYTRALIFPSVLGVLFYFFGIPYSAIYSSLLFIWSVVFVEWWRLQERILSVRWCTRGSFRVEKRRADFIPGFPWWRKEARKMASIPVILLFASVLAIVLTGVFVLEAFVTQLYKGPGLRIVAFTPTLLFSALVPRLLGVYKTIAQRYTDWENHAHQSSHANSLSIKVFTLSAVNAYLGLALSAFVYVPFGQMVMSLVQQHLFSGPQGVTTAILERLNLNITDTLKFTLGARGVITQSAAGAMTAKSLFEADTARARLKLNPSRLQEQMFAFSVTNPILDNVQDVVLPFLMRAIGSFRAGKGFRNGGGKGIGKKKRVAFDDEPAGQTHDDVQTREEREFLETVRSEACLPEYDTFDDYSEMVTQFGYVALWSTIWPLAPLMALLNNYIEARSDAFKIAVHERRPIPVRTDTIGPWLESLSFLAWLSAVTNSALVYMFRTPFNGLAAENENPHEDHVDTAIKDLLVSAFLIALLASHVYFVVRAVVRHTLEVALWRGSKEMKEVDRVEREIKQKYLAQSPSTPVESQLDSKHSICMQNMEDWASFWAKDEGLEEIRKSDKDE